MRTVLHLLTTPPDALTRTVLDLQQAAAAATGGRLKSWIFRSGSARLRRRA